MSNIVYELRFYLSTPWNKNTSLRTLDLQTNSKGKDMSLNMGEGTIQMAMVRKTVGVWERKKPLLDTVRKTTATVRVM